MRKWMTLFIIGWLMIGGYLFFIDDKDTTDGMNNYPDNQPKPDFNATYTWHLDDESQGTYKSPYWMRDESLVDYVHEMDHTAPSRNNNPEYQVFSFFAEAQMGSYRQLTTYLSPGKKSTDFENISVHNLDLIDQKLEEFATKITKDRSIKALYMSSPHDIGNDMITFDLVLDFGEEHLFEIVDFPLLAHKDESDTTAGSYNKSWTIDLTLSEISSLVQTAQKTERNPLAD